MQNENTATGRNRRRSNRRRRNSRSRSQKSDQGRVTPITNKSQGIQLTEELRTGVDGTGSLQVARENELQCEGDWLSRISSDGFQQTSIVTAVQYIIKYKKVRVGGEEEEEDTKNIHGESSSLNTAGDLQRPVIPSGKRRPEQGVEDEEQGILEIKINRKGEIVLDITQLVAGFIIGPKGVSIREISEVTSCNMKSWTVDESEIRRACRNFVLSGTSQALLQSLDIMLAAIDRYKHLAEGACSGTCVNRIQKIKGIDFFYYPPPKTKISYAASIQGAPSGINGGVRSGSNCEQLGDDRFVLQSRGNGSKPTASSIQQALQLSKENVDDVGCTHPGLFPQQIYKTQARQQRKSRSRSGGRRRDRNASANNSNDSHSIFENNDQQQLDRIIEVKGNNVQTQLPKKLSSKQSQNEARDRYSSSLLNTDRDSSQNIMQENIYCDEVLDLEKVYFEADPPPQVAPTPIASEEFPEINEIIPPTPQNTRYIHRFIDNQKLDIRENIVTSFSESKPMVTTVGKSSPFVSGEGLFESAPEATENVSSVGSVSFSEVYKSQTLPDFCLENVQNAEYVSNALAAAQEHVQNVGNVYCMPSSLQFFQSSNLSKIYRTSNFANNTMIGNVGNSEFTSNTDAVNGPNSGNVANVNVVNGLNAGNVPNVNALTGLNAVLPVSLFEEQIERITGDVDAKFSLNEGISSYGQYYGFTENNLQSLLENNFVGLSSQDVQISRADERVLDIGRYDSNSFSEVGRQSILADNFAGISSRGRQSFSGKENFPPINNNLSSLDCSRNDNQNEEEEQQILEWKRFPDSYLECESFHPAIGYEVFNKQKEEEQKLMYKLFSPDKSLQQFEERQDERAVGLQNICKFLGHIITVPENQESVVGDQGEVGCGGSPFRVPPNSQVNSISGETFFSATSRSVVACEDEQTENLLLPDLHRTAQK